MTLVECAVAVPVDGRFTYRVPRALQATLRLGHTLLVPFGNRRVTGYVLGPGQAVTGRKLKAIDRLLDPEPAFDAAQLRFFQWIARYYRSSLGEVIHTALPTAMEAHTKSAHRATDAGVDALALGAVEGEEAEVLREVIDRPGLTRRGLQRRLGELVGSKETGLALDRLRRQDLVDVDQVEVGGPGGTERWAVVARAPEEELTGRKKSVYEALPSSVPELVAAQGPYARTVLKKLGELVRIETREKRDPVVQGEMPHDSVIPTLTGPQKAAVEAIREPKTHLLHGVTGAGKTEVYLHAAAEVLEQGRQVLVLVPEIGLTPLLTGRFRARFGDAIAVLHSGLTGAQRLREWRRIRAGEATIAVGARSALFAPFHDLGLLVVDEEHDGSYKQDEGVKYSARDLAVVLGHMRRASVVLGSATPSLETFHNAHQDRYGLIELLTRPTPSPVPTIELVDLNAEERGPDGRVPIVSTAVQQALQATFDRGGKAIVLYNRRGYATLVECLGCGAGFTCPSCGVSLVLHQSHRTLICHYCGFHRDMPSDCPSCAGALDIRGKGTQKVEEVLSELFPSIPMARMDADTTSVRGSHHRILEGFRKGESRLLVGTQIVAKGHDFPDVHVAAVLGADHILSMPDFRSAERTFALVTQLAGRAGRGAVGGRVLVQTRSPNHPVYKRLGDFGAFAGEELRQRRLLSYPPYSRLALLRIEGADRPDTVEVAWTIQQRLRATCDGKTIQVLGPAAAAMPRLVGRWRFQVLLKSMDDALWRRWLPSIDLSVPRGKKVRVVLDVDPLHLL
ncbi:MAG: primosomal protein N' [Proteobacteria bacterium]|nr:primosomal protein N' [Pseudomonadota bacterium]